MVRILLAEDQAMVRGALAALLATERDMAVVATVSNGFEALEAIQLHSPNVLITDVEMPGLNGLDLAAKVHKEHPTMSILILTTFARPGYLRRALESGARGYLLKDRPSSELAEAVRQMQRGRQVIDPVLATDAWEIGPDPLSSREREILVSAAEGRSNSQIAKAIHLSEGTVKNYLAQINEKLGTSNRTEACARARSLGWF